MPTTELFRFRTVRPVQNKQEGFSALAVTPSPGLIKPPPGGVASPQCANLLNVLSNQGVNALLGGFAWLQQVSEQLAASADEIPPSTLIAFLPPTWTTQVGATINLVSKVVNYSAAWAALGQTLADTLGCVAMEVRTTAGTPGNYGIPVVQSSVTQQIELLTRLCLVRDCISTLASDQQLPLAQRQLQSASDIQTALAFRSVALPTECFSYTPPVLARAPGVTDLSVVQDEWNRYVAGELSNVVNVLPGETFDSGSRHLEKIVQAQSTTNAQTTTQTTENSQTTSNTLSSAASSDSSLNIGAHAQVETSGQYGPTKVSTNIGGQVQSSQSSSQSTARTTAVETVARAVKTVSQTITQVQSTTTTTKDSSHEEHKLQNTSQSVTVGLYRWLSEIHRVQLVNYPNRLVLEFEIPEPGAWLQWALNNQPLAPYDNPNPGPFAGNRNDYTLSPLNSTNPDVNAPLLKPTDISPAIASALAARWRVQGLTSPPALTITIGNSYTITPQANAPVTLNDNSMTVPDGYVAQTWFLDVTGVGGDDKGGHAANLRVAVGGYGATFSVWNNGTALLFWGNQAGANVVQKNIPQPSTNPPPPITTGFSAPAGPQTPVGGLPVGDINTGTIPVSANGDFLSTPNNGITLNVGVQCGQIPAVGDANGNGQPYVQWQVSTFNTIASAYQNLLSAFNQERDARAQQQTAPLIVGPPSLNLSRAVAELKRLAIQNLLGEPFFGYDLLTIVPPNPNPYNIQPGEPWLNPAGTSASSPVIQFFEQAFEWVNIVYICYPYFWGGHERWVTNATWASADPVFDQFLSAGSVRLVVPATPGFEHAVNFFLYTSMVWSGKNPPGPNDPGYLSVADEIQSIQVGPTDGTPVYPPWEITLPTTLLWAGTDPTTLPVNPNPTIGPPPPTPEATAITVSSSVNPSAFGQPVSFTAVAAAASGLGTPSGQVNFLIDGLQTPDSPVTLDKTGKATSAAVASLAVGMHTVTADYLGDGTFGAVEASLPTQAVNEAPAAVTVTSSANPSVFGQPVTLAAVVAAVAPGAGTPSGQVNFLIDGATFGSPVTLDGTGKATSAAVTGMSASKHTVAVNYLGDGNFVAATGNLAAPQTVGQSASSVFATSSTNSSKASAPVTFTAVVTAVSPGVGIPTGQVNFLVDGTATAGGPVTLNTAGTASSAAITTLTKGTHKVTVTYSGDPNFAASSSGTPLTQKVN